MPRFKDEFSLALLRATKSRVEAIAEEEAAEASRRLAARIDAEVDNLVLSIMSNYDIADNGGRLTITVNKAGSRSG